MRVTWVRKFSQSANDVLWLNDKRRSRSSGQRLSLNQHGDTWSQISSQIFTGFDEMTLLPTAQSSAFLLPATPAQHGGGFNWTRTLVGPGALRQAGRLFFDDQTGRSSTRRFIFKTTTASNVDGTEQRIGECVLRFGMFDDNTGSLWRQRILSAHDNGGSHGIREVASHGCDFGPQ